MTLSVKRQIGTNLYRGSQDRGRIGDRGVNFGLQDLITWIARILDLCASPSKRAELVEWAAELRPHDCLYRRMVPSARSAQSLLCQQRSRGLPRTVVRENERCFGILS